MSILDTPRRPTFLSMLVRDLDAIIEKRLYLGGLSTASDRAKLEALGITHVLSVCRESSWNEPTRMTIDVDDNPHENLLIWLPEACEFIEKALDSGGAVYVHCALGVSRSPAVVCAYLMKSQGMSTEDALTYVKSKRPIVRPNFGFMEQLDVWKACNFAPSVLHPIYCAWKRTRGWLPNSDLEPTLLDERLYMIEDLPKTARALASFLRRFSVTHLITMNPHQPIAMSELTPDVERHHLSLVDGSSDELALKLPEAVNFIDHGLKENSEAVILIHSFDLTRICILVCAYWMAVRHTDDAGAFHLLEAVLPLFSPTTDFADTLSLFKTCEYAPTPTHPEIIAFRAGRKQGEEYQNFEGLWRGENVLRITSHPPEQREESKE